MNMNPSVYRARGYKLTLSPERFLVTVAEEDERAPAFNDVLPDWIFDSEYVMWLSEGSAPIRERALAGEWIKTILSRPQLKSIA